LKILVRFFKIDNFFQTFLIEPTRMKVEIVTSGKRQFYNFLPVRKVSFRTFYQWQKTVLELFFWKNVSVFLCAIRLTKIKSGRNNSFGEVLHECINTKKCNRKRWFKAAQKRELHRVDAKEKANYYFVKKFLGF
jgi:predicted CopG family antitoxin